MLAQRRRLRPLPAGAVGTDRRDTPVGTDTRVALRAVVGIEVQNLTRWQARSMGAT